MHKRILFFILFIPLNAYSQYALFNSYDFAKGEYTLYCTVYWDQSDFTKKYGDFYINDIHALEEIKEKWIFEEGDGAACGYDYSIYLVRNDSILDGWQLNIECGFLEHDGKFYGINIERRNLLIQKYKHLSKIDKDFADYKKARKHYQLISKNACNFIPHKWNYPWAYYDGRSRYKRKFYIEGERNDDSLYTVIKDEVLSELKDSSDVSILPSIDGYRHIEFSVSIYTNQPIKKHLPNYELVDPWEEFKEVNLRYYVRNKCP